MALGQAIDPVVEQQDREVDVAAQGMDEVVAANRQRITVTGDDPHPEVLAGRGDTGGDRGGPAVDGVHAIRVDVVGESRRAANARHDHRVLLRNAQFG